MRKKGLKFLFILCIILTLAIPITSADVEKMVDAPSVSDTHTLSNISDKPILIGVLANRGLEIARKEWGPTADYLSRELSPLQFTIVPLDFQEITKTVENQEVSFVCANPSVYTYMEYYGHATRIATLQVPGDPYPQALFGGVIFTRSDRNDIQDLSDLRGKTFAAVDKTSLGGWQAALAEMLDADIDPQDDLTELNFTGTHDAAVTDVLHGLADAGTARSTQLEQMAKEGTINLSEIKILNDKHSQYPTYPYLLSTDLYPEWPFAAVTGTDLDLSKKVSVALLMMEEDDPAAKAVHGAGWAIPQDHTTVHELLRRLNLPPYEMWGKSTPEEVLHQYWLTILGIVLGILTLSIVLLNTWKTKKSLALALVKVKESESSIKQSKEKLELVNAELKSSNEELAESKREIQRKNDELTALSIILQKNEEKYRLLADNSTDVIWTMDFEGLFTYVSPSVFQLRGYSPEEAIHQTIHEAVCPGSILTIEQNIRQALDYLNKGIHDKSVTIEIEQPCRDGKTVWTEVITRLIFNDAGEPIGFLGVSRDITQRRLIQQALIENEKKFVSIFAFTPDPIIILNNDLRIIEVNRGFERIFAVSANSVEGKDLVESGILHPDDIPKILEGTDLLLTVQRRELTFITKTGMSFIAEVAISQIIIQTEPCLLIQIHDIDEIRRAHDAVTQVNNKMKILSNITRHDILNRIMIAYLYCEEVNTGISDDNLHLYREKIIKAMEEIQILIEFTGQYQDLGATSPKWQKIQGIINRQSIQGLAPGITLISDLSGLSIYADPMLEKVVYNLVENSVRHGKDLTHISVTCHEEKENMVLYYEDDGGGIAIDEKEKAFEKGFGKNTGLGLFLIREILSITSITITETGDPGVGVRFEIHVPAGKWQMGEK